MKIITGEPIKLDDDKVEVDDDQSINNSDLSDALKGDTMTSLRLKINELQREISRLREGKPSDDDANTQLLVLQHMVDEANRVKAKVEKVNIYCNYGIHLLLFYDFSYILLTCYLFDRTILKFKKKNLY